jgi:two-component system chemotaxis sensor kinase CheA
MMGEMDAYKDVFIAESADYLQQITEGLLSLEADPTDQEPVEVIFRGAHSLKGMSAAMGYNRTADLTHKMEGMMDRVRKGELTVKQPVIDMMLAALDVVRDLIEDESAGKSDIDADEVIAALEAMTAGAAPGVAADETEDVPSVVVDPEGGTVWLAKVTLDESCVLKAVRAYMVIKRLAHMGNVIETHPPAREIEDERFDREFEIVLATESTESAIREAIAAVSEVAEVVVAPYATASVAPVSEAAPIVSPSGQRRRRDLPKLSQTQTVRVSIGHLDTLVDLVGELVILRSRLEDISTHRLDPELHETLDELQRISTELQYEVMQTRMVPVGNIFNRFPRMVRDLAVDLGKQIDFRMSGLDIELDRTVLDEIGDPLVHLLRNSIDHGIEPSDVRVKAGKAKMGTVTLSACRERDHVAIVVSDDGRGIDLEKVWSKAVERGMAKEDERQDYDESDILLFTCVPGFSTVESATKVSGRGVGMDVVKGKIEHLGGTVRISSRVGEGTDFALRLPLTLAIVQALVVESAGHEFAIPLSSVDEVFQTDEVQVDSIDSSPVVVLRDGEVVPMRRLDTLLLDVEADAQSGPRSSVVLLQTGTERVALQVDSLVDRLEVVLKPLSSLLRDSKGFSGATILGDGRVMLVIDPRTILSAAGE